MSVVPNNPIRMAIITFAGIAQPRSGSTIRMRAAIEDIAALGVEVTVLSLDESIGGYIHSEKLPIQLLHVSKSSNTWLWSRRKFKLHWVFNLARQIQLLKNEHDTLVISSAMFMPSVFLARWHGRIVFEQGEIETLHYQRLRQTWSNRWRRWIWRLLEHWATNRAVVVVAISETDATAWAETFPRCCGKLVVVGHRYWSQVKDVAPMVVSEKSPPPSTATQVQSRLVFLGNMVAKQNRASAKWIYEDLILKLKHPVTVLFIGSGTENFPQGLFGRCKIVAVGEIEDLTRVVRIGDIGIAPIEAAGGVKTKVLDYLALGLLIVGTPTAFEGLDTCPDLVCAPLNEFPEVIDELLASPESEEARMQRLARQRAWQFQHGKSLTLKQWKTVLSQLFPEFN